jgi:hypothetical protein
MTSAGNTHASASASIAAMPKANGSGIGGSIIRYFIVPAGGSIAPSSPNRCGTLGAP